LIVARNVLTGEVKYFLSNRVPGERNPITGQWITLRWLLRVAFGRWSIESCFREGKLDKQQYYQRRSKQARRSHTKTRISRLTAMGIDVEKIKSCIPDT